MNYGIHIFSTSIGQCAVAWNENGIVRVELPCGSAAKTKARMVKFVPDAVVVNDPPATIASTIKRIQRHLIGECDDMRDVSVDFSGFTPFTRKVYRSLRNVKPGEVVTYGELARLAGAPRAARAVGRAMATNPIPLIIPCHRVLPADGSLGGFSAAEGPSLKARLLKIENSNSTK